MEQIISLLDYLREESLILDMDEALRSAETSQEASAILDRLFSGPMKTALYGPKKDLLKQINGSPWVKAIAKWRLQQ
jgi:hypothetical protein